MGSTIPSIIPIVMFIATGSISLRNDFIKLFLICISISLFSPMILLSRQLICWNYILKRLVSENVEYEKSGWYDGDIWEKPISWRQRDLLVAQHEVRPAIKHIKEQLIINISLIIYKC